MRNTTGQAISLARELETTGIPKPGKERTIRKGMTLVAEFKTPMLKTGQSHIFTSLQLGREIFGSQK